MYRTEKYMQLLAGQEINQNIMICQITLACLHQAKPFFLSNINESQICAGLVENPRRDFLYFSQTASTLSTLFLCTFSISFIVPVLLCSLLWFKFAGLTSTCLRYSSLHKERRSFFLVVGKVPAKLLD